MTERLTDEAALAMARETAGKAYVSSIPDICDEDREMWLYAYRAGRWKNSPSVQSALAAIRAIEDRHEAEIATLCAENARLQRIADAQPGFDNVIIAQLRAEIAALKAKLAERPTNTSERERVARALSNLGAFVAVDAWKDRRVKLDDLEALIAADAALSALDRPTISTDVVEALAAMVYETTSLSPMKTNGDHDCTIRSATLKAARAALRATHTITGGKDD